MTSLLETLCRKRLRMAAVRAWWRPSRAAAGAVAGAGRFAGDGAGQATLPRHACS
ncbi:hypothetical protein ACFQZ4_00085 [Catellatospora coxensis]